jgi:hypothetical protein
MHLLLTFAEHGPKTFTELTKEPEQLAQRTNLLLHVCIDHLTESQIKLIDD